MKVCTKCKIEKPISDFFIDKRRGNKPANPCKKCKADSYFKHRAERLSKMREYSLTHAEEAKARAKAWRLANKDKRARQANIRRARKRNLRWEKYSEFDVLSLYGATCHICNEEIDLKANRKPGELGWERGLHFDHVVALAQGGTDTLDNVKPAHGKCNLTKAKRLAEL